MKEEKSKGTKGDKAKEGLSGEPTSDAGEEVKSEAEVDSLIEDELDLDDFTAETKYMQGAPIPQEVLDRVESKLEKQGRAFDGTQYNLPDTYYSNLTANKTGYQTTTIMRDYEFKKENLISILQ